MIALRLLPPVCMLAAALAVAAPPPEGGRYVESPDPQLPAGAAPQYQLGRSLLQQGDAEAALPYLHRAFRLAPAVERFGVAYLDALVGTGHSRDALEVAAALSRMAPAKGPYRRRYGVLLAGAGRYRDALGEVQAARKLGPDDVELVKLEMDLHESLGDVRGALAAGEAARRSLPESGADLVLMEAAVLRRARRTPEAAAKLRGLLNDDPDAATVRLALMQTLVDANDLAGAAAVAADGDAGRVRSPDAPPSFRAQLAELLGRQGHFAAAADILAQLRASGEADLDAQLWLGRLLLGLERTTEALSLLPAIAGQWPASGEAQYLWGKALLLGDDPAAALTHLREGARLAPDRTEFRLTLLQALVVSQHDALTTKSPSAGDRALRAEVAEHARLAASQVKPDDPGGQLVLGYAFRALGKNESAADHFAAAAKVNDVRLQAAMELAFCQQDLGRFGEARETLEGLYRDFPDDPDVANSLGYFLADQGADLQRAERLVRQALRAEPESGAYLDSLGWVLFQRGEHANAFDVLVNAANQRPDDAVILEHLGLTLKALGQRDQALGILRRSLAAGGDPGRLQPIIEGLERGDR